MVRIDPLIIVFLVDYIIIITLLFVRGMHRRNLLESHPETYGELEMLEGVVSYLDDHSFFLVLFSNPRKQNVEDKNAASSCVFLKK